MARTFMRLMVMAQNQLQIPRDQIQIDNLDSAFRMFWDHHPWRETLGDFPPFYLVPNWQKYEAPYVQWPTDFKDLYAASMVQVSTQGSTEVTGLDVIGNLEDETSQISSIEPALGYSAVYDAIMISNPPSAIPGRLYVAAKYKKDYPYALTADNAAANQFPMPRHEQIFFEILKWYIKGMPVEEFEKVGLLLRQARRAETPGFQDADEAPDSSYSHLGA